ncbi:MAG: pyrimidine reductase family protein [Solirubrobacterales bacterium]|nr:MAG: pyrimidine reductase family protein [Solirubrobacterales bacterium]
MEFNRLLPEPGTVELEGLLASVELGPSAPADRPYTIVNFVASADGRATLGGRSGPLGDDGDHALFHGLRERVDAVLAGTVTLRTERYGRILKPERRRRRVQRAVAPEPLTCMVTRSGEIPLEIPLFAEPEAKVVVFSPVAIDVSGARAEVVVVQLDPAELTLTTALARLRCDHGVRVLLCEGGPTLFGALLAEHLVDELFLTIVPKLAGGGRGPTIASGPELAEPQGLRLTWLLERGGSLYLRSALS